MTPEQHDAIRSALAVAREFIERPAATNAEAERVIALIERALATVRDNPEIPGSQEKRP